MKVLTVSVSDDGGGASRSAYRLHECLRTRIDSRMLVLEKKTKDPAVDCIFNSNREKYTFRAKNKFSMAIARMCAPDYHSTNYASLAIFKSRLVNIINRIAPDIVHFHWLGTELISIEDLAKVQVPIVVTLHDMWMFSGAFHLNYSEVSKNLEKYRLQLSAGIRAQKLENWMVRRKDRAWAKSNITMVAPSSWMARRAQASSIGSIFPVFHIPNAVDLAAWSPIPKDEARKSLGLNSDSKIIVFGANNPESKLKGLFLLQEALERIPSSRFQLVTYGGTIKSPRYSNYVSLGKISDTAKLRAVLSAGDVFALPSLIENLPNVAIESLACGLPVVSFSTGGLPEILNGADGCQVCATFDTSKFAALLEKVANDLTVLRKPIRPMVDCLPDLIAEKHINLYNNILQNRQCAC